MCYPKLLTYFHPALELNNNRNLYNLIFRSPTTKFVSFSVISVFISVIPKQYNCETFPNVSLRTDIFVLWLFLLSIAYHIHIFSHIYIFFWIDMKCKYQV
jgi:hypothetical protein